MWKILDAFMAWVVAPKEESPSFSNNDFVVFYGVLVLLASLMIGSTLE
ncbi:hypothetical protein [Adhaeribacter aquaticus]|nr:hypothetical protein [Adhaeribacter aquaticus]